MSFFRGWPFLILAIGLAGNAACDGGGMLPPDGSTDATVSDGVSAMDAGGSCLGSGTGALVATLQLAPGLLIARTDVWIAAMCVLADGRELSVRVVRATTDNAPIVLDGLGAGTYVVRASAALAPGAESPQLSLNVGATAITSLTIANGPWPIAQLHVVAPGLVDAGTPTDAALTDVSPPSDAVATTDTAPPPTDGPVIDAALTDAALDDTAAVDAGLDAGMLPVDAANGPDAGTDAWTVATSPFITVISQDGGVQLGQMQAQVMDNNGQSVVVEISVQRSGCTGGACDPLVLAPVELRTSTTAGPAGVAVGAFDRMTLQSGETGIATRILIPGHFTSADLTLDVSLFGALVAPDGGRDGGGSVHDP